MNRWISIFLSAAVLGLSAPSVVLAAYSSANVLSGHEAKTASVMFQNGGRDAVSQKRMNNAITDFDLRLQLSGKPAGEDWGDVEVQIFDAGHNDLVKQRLVGGPFLYLNLPKGNYRVVAKDPAGRTAVVEQIEVSTDAPVPLHLHIKS